MYAVGQLVAVTAIVFAALAAVCESINIAGCCTTGERQFLSTDSCHVVGLLNSDQTAACRRTATVCCLQAMFDDRCDAGALHAKRRGVCPVEQPRGGLGAGAQKECCECCLLAKELASSGWPCSPPATFSVRCKRSFSTCCEAAFAFTGATASATIVSNPQARVSTSNSMDSQSLSMPSSFYSTRRPGGGYASHEPIMSVSLGDRCRTAMNTCQHYCVDRGADQGIECQCRPGYKLHDDGRSCIDIDECTESTTHVCDRHLERCYNKPGGYDCHPIRSGNRLSEMDRICPVGYERSPVTGTCVDINECKRNSSACGGPQQTCINSPGSYHCLCSTGYSWDLQLYSCVDIDECMLMVDECTEGQRCLNTPGSYRCLRTKSCGTGYYLNPETETCIDVDECALGTHNCVAGYRCDNTQGSFRCRPSNCAPGLVLNERTKACEPMDCPVGYRPDEEQGSCVDDNECESSPTPACRPFEKCRNTPGSYVCEPRDDFCEDGFELQSDSGVCVDTDECSVGTHKCMSDEQCINLQGSYRCRCEPGYEFNATTRACEDIDECERFHGHVCSLDAICENVPGSFTCHCKQGFRLAEDGRHCEDVDECAMGTARCDQRCANVPGSYQCICNAGYTLASDGHACVDIDECQAWTGAGAALCMGRCVNTAGSYRCQCPQGFQVLADGRTCRDVDECAAGACRGHGTVCVNTLGAHKCHHIDCPINYVHDDKFKNRCNRTIPVCPVGNQQCLSMASHVTYEFMALPKKVDFGDRPALTLFTLRGPAVDITRMQFELRMNDAITLSKIQGGWACVQHCRQDDYLCIANHTKSIHYQFAALPAIRFVPQPFEVTRVRVEAPDGNPFYVKYVLDAANRNKFSVAQDRNIGIVQLIAPIHGPWTEHIRLHMNVYSRNHVLISHNVAQIEIYVSEYHI